VLFKLEQRTPGSSFLLSKEECMKRVHRGFYIEIYRKFVFGLAANPSPFFMTFSLLGRRGLGDF